MNAKDIIQQAAPKNESYHLAQSSDIAHAVICGLKFKLPRVMGVIPEGDESFISGFIAHNVLEIVTETLCRLWRRLPRPNNQEIMDAWNPYIQRVFADFREKQQQGLLDEEYSNDIISVNDKERAKDIVGVIVHKLLEHTKLFAPKQSGVKIPFTKSVAHGIHQNKDVGEWGMTIMDRTMRYLAVITKVNMDSRPKILDIQTGKVYVILIFEDLRETLELMGTASSMLRPYVAD